MPYTPAATGIGELRKRIEKSSCMHRRGSFQEKNPPAKASTQKFSLAFGENYFAVLLSSPRQATGANSGRPVVGGLPFQDCFPILIPRLPNIHGCMVRFLRRETAFRFFVTKTESARFFVSNSGTVISHIQPVVPNQGAQENRKLRCY